MNAPGFAYKNGFKNPSGLLPAESNSSLINATIPAKIGLEQLVPSTSSVRPLTTISRFVPIAATSGMARPERLNLPESVFPRVERKEETADAW